MHGVVASCRRVAPSSVCGSEENVGMVARALRTGVAAKRWSSLTESYRRGYDRRWYGRVCRQGKQVTTGERSHLRDSDKRNGRDGNVRTNGAHAISLATEEAGEAG